jgi:hypothetical protein
MQEDAVKLDAIFGEAISFIHRYTREEALADGVLVDVSKTAQEAGFGVPVAMTVAAWSRVVKWSDADSARQTSQDEAGRLWDVLWMGHIAARRANGNCRVTYQLHVVPRGGRATRPRQTSLAMVIGPGDRGEPVLIIMNPDED